MTRTHIAKWLTLLSVVLALALTACGSDEPSGVTGPARTASPPTETPASPAQTPTTPGSGDAPTATDTPVPATAPPAVSGSVETDRDALVALYNATNGENWLSFNNNWLSDAPIGEWYGVTAGENGRVIELVLDGTLFERHGLRGKIPGELGSLANLKRLSLNWNELSGEIPSELGNLANLQELLLNGNQLSGRNAFLAGRTRQSENAGSRE